jgi:CRP/FNR family transcriptional regulator, anaerobic regulatory protein
MNTHMAGSTEIIDLNIVKATCAECNLSELCLPRGLHRDDMNRMEQLVRRTRPLRRGEWVFRNGDAFNAIYAVRSGSIKLYHDTDEGEEEILGFYLPGELLGFDAIHSGHHQCSALALETSSICAFPYQRLEEACERIESLRQQMSRLMSREISTENEFLLTLRHKSAEERVAAFLVNLALRHQRLGYSAREFKLPMSREEIGNYLGLTTETISRILTKLQREGVMVAKRRFVEIKNADQLHKRCHSASCHQKGTAAS